MLDNRGSVENIYLIKIAAYLCSNQKITTNFIRKVIFEYNREALMSSSGIFLATLEVLKN